MIRPSLWRLAPIGLLSFVLAAAELPGQAAEGRSAKGRTAPAGASAGGSGRSAASGRVARPGSRTVARGTATYGYRGAFRHRRYYVGAPYYFGYGYYWAYPYGYWGSWYPRPHVYVTSDGYERRAPAVVETDVKPKKSEVWVDGEFRGQARDFNGAWDVLYVAPGTHTVEFRYPGYQTLRIELRSRAGSYYQIVERLQKGEGVDARSLDVPQGEARLPDQRREAEGEPAYRDELPGDAASLRRGLLRIRAEPTDAAVYLDGEFLARADELSRLHGAIPVAEGQHRIEVVRPGYVARSEDVLVEGSEPVRVEITLQRAERRR